MEGSEWEGEMEGGEMVSPEPALIPAISSGFEPLERGGGEGEEWEERRAC